MKEKCTPKKRSVLLFYCCVEHTHKESLFTLARERERKERSYCWCCCSVGFFVLHIRERERERVCVQ